MTSIVLYMEDDLNNFVNGRRPQFVLLMEDNLKKFVNERQSHKCLKMEDDLKFICKWTFLKSRLSELAD